MSFNAALTAANGGFATASSPLTYVTGTPTSAIDHDDSTYLQTNYLPTEGRILDLDLGATRHITSVRLLDAHGDGHGWKASLFGSDDGTTWTEAWSITHSSAAPHDTGIVALTTPLTARYWRYQGPMVATGLGEIDYLFSLELWSDDATPGTGGTDGSTGVGGPAYSGDLAAWLSSDNGSQLHETDGLPWLTKTAVDAIKVVTDKLGASGSGNSLNWVKALWDLAGDFSDAEIGWLKGFLAKRDQLVGASGGGGSAFYGPSGTQVAEGVETLLASGITPTTLGAAIALLREQLTLSPDLSDTSRWTLVDTTSGDGDALISQQADAYFLSITAYPSTQPAHGVAGTLWLPRWGWVCPRVHGHFAQRQFHDVMPTIVTSEGHFMDGLLIYTPPGFEWTCESYVLDR